MLDRTIDDGANTLQRPRPSVWPTRSPRRNEARKRAVADAMARATLLSEAAGRKLGPMVSITEGGGYRRTDADVPAWTPMAAAPVPVAAGEVLTAASVTMVVRSGRIRP